MEKHHSMNQRRLRVDKHVRELAASVTLDHRKFIQPLFVQQNLQARKYIVGMQDIWTDNIETVLETIEHDMNEGVTKFLLFPVPAYKSETSFNFDFATSVVKVIKDKFGSDIWLLVDICLCSYTTHGHCGILTPDHSRLLNDLTVSCLADYALIIAKAGADGLAPSDMTDGRIRAIRDKLDDHHLDHVIIMSYSSKFASQYYGPFRDACDSTPNSRGLQDRKTYQISPTNIHDAVSSTMRDVSEGADFVMVKPAALYTDVIAAIKNATLAPVAAYHVSGEYASIQLMANEGLLDKQKAHLEVWTALVRSGADVIISYAARFARSWIGNREV
ncbi:MAG: porphobilinogen synthase [Saprospiraceae bacterium]